MTRDPELDAIADEALTAAPEVIKRTRLEAEEARRRGDVDTAQLRDFQADRLGRTMAKLVDARSGRRLIQLRAQWIALIRAHRATDKPRPKLIEVAEKMGWNSEQPLRDYCRELGVENWHDVHTIVAAARV
jgi:hypothetical protein